jgi:hypothetical protein
MADLEMSATGEADRLARALERIAQAGPALARAHAAPPGAARLAEATSRLDSLIIEVKAALRPQA